MPYALPKVLQRAVDNATPREGQYDDNPGPEERQAFIQRSMPAAERVGAELGIDPAYLVAIKASETNWGRAQSAFGIKGKGPSGKSAMYDTWEVINGQRVPVRDEFAVYDSEDEAYQHLLGPQVLGGQRYAGAMETLRKTHDPQEFLKQVNEAGYATDPNWWKSIVSIASQISGGITPGPREGYSTIAERNAGGRPGGRSLGNSMSGPGIGIQMTGTSPGNLYGSPGQGIGIDASGWNPSEAFSSWDAGIRRDRSGIRPPSTGTGGLLDNVDATAPGEMPGGADMGPGGFGNITYDDNLEPIPLAQPGMDNPQPLPNLRPQNEPQFIPIAQRSSALVQNVVSPPQAPAATNNSADWQSMQEAVQAYDQTMKDLPKPQYNGSPGEWQSQQEALQSYDTTMKDLPVDKSFPTLDPALIAAQEAGASDYYGTTAPQIKDAIAARYPEASSPEAQVPQAEGPPGVATQAGLEDVQAPQDSLRARAMGQQGPVPANAYYPGSGTVQTRAPGETESPLETGARVISPLLMGFEPLGKALTRPFQQDMFGLPNLSVGAGGGVVDRSQGVTLPQAGGRAYMTELPYISPFMRNEVQPRAGDVGEFLGGKVGLGGAGRTIAEALTPITAGDFAANIVGAKGIGEAATGLPIDDLVRGGVRRALGRGIETGTEQAAREAIRLEAAANRAKGIADFRGMSPFERQMLQNFEILRDPAKAMSKVIDDTMHGRGVLVEAAKGRLQANLKTIVRDNGGEPSRGTAADRRYGEQVRTAHLARLGPEETARIDAYLEKSGETWADYGDALRVFDPATPSWQRPPEEVGLPQRPADSVEELKTQMRQAVQDVRDEKAGRGTLAQMREAQQRVREGGGPANSIIGPNDRRPPLEAPKGPEVEQQRTDLHRRLDEVDNLMRQAQQNPAAFDPQRLHGLYRDRVTGEVMQGDEAAAKGIARNRLQTIEPSLEDTRRSIRMDLDELDRPTVQYRPVAPGTRLAPEPTERSLAQQQADLAMALQKKPRQFDDLMDWEKELLAKGISPEARDLIEAQRGGNDALKRLQGVADEGAKYGSAPDIRYAGDDRQLGAVEMRLRNQGYPEDHIKSVVERQAATRDRRAAGDFPGRGGFYTPEDLTSYRRSIENLKTDELNQYRARLQESVAMGGPGAAADQQQVDVIDDVLSAKERGGFPRRTRPTTSWNVTNAQGETRTVQTEVPISATPEEAQARFAANTEESRRLNRQAAIDQRVGSAQQAREGVARVRAGETDPRFDYSTMSKTDRFSVSSARGSSTKGWLDPDGNLYAMKGEADHWAAMEGKDEAEVLRDGWVRVTLQNEGGGKKGVYLEGLDDESIREAGQKMLKGMPLNERMRADVVIDTQSTNDVVARPMRMNAQDWMEQGMPTSAPRGRGGIAEEGAKYGERRGAEQGPNVVRVAVRDDAIKPLDPNSLVGSRGAVEVTDPAGVRVLQPGEQPGDGERLMFHGTNGELRGDLRAGTNLTPNEQDAQVFARTATNLEAARETRLTELKPPEAQRRASGPQSNIVPQTSGGGRRERLPGPDDITFAGEDGWPTLDELAARVGADLTPYKGRLAREKALQQHIEALREASPEVPTGIGDAYTYHSGPTELTATNWGQQVIELTVNRQGAGGWTGRAAGSDPGALSETGETINKLVAENPDYLFVAAPTDARRSRIYQMAGFRPATEAERFRASNMIGRDSSQELLVLDRGLDTRVRPGQGPAFNIVGANDVPAEPVGPMPAKITQKELGQIILRPLADQPKAFHETLVPEQEAKRAVFIRSTTDFMDKAAPVHGAPVEVNGLQFGTWKDTPTWVKETEGLLSPQEIDQAGRWYREAKATFGDAFGVDEDTAGRLLNAFLVSQVQQDVKGGVRNVLQGEDRAFFNRLMDKGFAKGPQERAIMNALKENPSLEGISRKISDFIDSAEGKQVRAWAGNDARGGAPFVVDVWTGRDAGFVDSEVLRSAGKDKAGGIKADFPGGTVAPSEAQYEAASAWGSKLTEELNAQKWMGRSDWTPAEVQAIGWTKMKKAFGTSEGSIQEAIRQNTRRITVPDVLTDLDARGLELSPQEAIDASRAYLDNVESWLRENIPNARLTRVDVPDGLHHFDVFASPDTAEDVADSLAFHTGSDVLTFRPLKTGKRPGWQLRSGTDAFTPEQYADIARALKTDSITVTPFNLPDGGQAIRVVGMPNSAQGQKALEQKLAHLDLEVDATPANFDALTYNRGSDGKAAIQAVSSRGRPDLAGALERSAPERERWLDDAISRAQREAPNAIAEQRAPYGAAVDEAQRAAAQDVTRAGAQEVNPGVPSETPPVPTAAASVQGPATSPGAGSASNIVNPNQVGRTPATASGTTPGAPKRSVVGSVLSDVLNEAGGAVSAPMSLKSSLSPPVLRQGLARVVTNPAAAFREFAQSMKAALSEKDARVIQDAINANQWVRETKGATDAADQAAQAAYKAQWDKAGPVMRSNMKPPTPTPRPFNEGYTWKDVGGDVLDWSPEETLNKLRPAELKKMLDDKGYTYAANATKSDLVDQIGRNLKPEDIAGYTNSRIGRFAERATAPSNRQAAVQLNLNRTNWYADVASKMWEAGIRDPEAYVELRKTIEQFTQRGSWRQPTRIPVFFSTRAMSGRIQSTWRGLEALAHPTELLKPGARQEAAKAFTATIAANMAFLGGAYAAADALGLEPSIEMDGSLPTLKVGQNHFDPWAGVNTPAKFALGLMHDTMNLKGMKEGGAEDVPQAAIASLASRGEKFLRGGLNPVLGKAVDTAKGRTFTGEKYNLAEDIKSGNFALDMVTPFIAETLVDSWKANGLLGTAAIAPGAFLSTGINTYETSADKADKVSRQIYGGKHFNDLTDIERLPVIDKLEDRDQASIKKDARAIYEERLTKSGYLPPPTKTDSDGKKVPVLESLTDKAKREAKNEEVIAKDPELDVQKWYYGSKDGGALHSKEAVDQVLKSGFAPERKVTYAGNSRNLNATEDDKRFWQEYGQSVHFIEKELRNDPKNLEAAAQQKYKLPYAKLTDTQKGSLGSDILAAAKRDPKVEALMIFAGQETPNADGQYVASNQAVVDAFNELVKKYPKAAPLPLKENSKGKKTTLVMLRKAA